MALLWAQAAANYQIDWFHQTTSSTRGYMWQRAAKHTQSADKSIWLANKSRASQIQHTFPEVIACVYGIDAKWSGTIPPQRLSILQDAWCIQLFLLSKHPLLTESPCFRPCNRILFCTDSHAAHIIRLCPLIIVSWLKIKVRCMPLLYQQSKTPPLQEHAYPSGLEQSCQGVTYYKRPSLVREMQQDLSPDAIWNFKNTCSILFWTANWKFIAKKG
jgi:hypothetical protein